MAGKGTKPWNAGTAKGWIDQSGYMSIKVGTKTHRIHRLVMEGHLGRKLEPWEAIHHKDENKLNNAIENLEIVTFSEHSAEHHRGTKRSTETKRSIRLFQQMTHALKAEREVKAELLEALKKANELIKGLTSAVCGNEGLSGCEEFYRGYNAVTRRNASDAARIAGEVSAAICKAENPNG